MAQSWRSGPRGETTNAPPLDADRLERMALRYVERYATTRAKLTAYLNRKLRERGYAEGEAPDLAALVERLAGLGYVDDQTFAAMRGGALSRRGYGPRRIALALREAGVGEADAACAEATARDQAWEAALRFAQRRKIGPFAAGSPDRQSKEKAFAALLRAGHSMADARLLANAEPGTIPERDTR